MDFETCFESPDSRICSVFGQNDAGLGNDRPFLLWNVVLVDVNVVTVSVQVGVEHKWSVHEGAWIDETASLTNLHLFDIEDEASVENVECCCGLSTEKQDLVVSDLMSQSHISRHPV